MSRVPMIDVDGSIRVERIGPATLATVQYGLASVKGLALRHPDDIDDPGIGARLAVARALRKLSKVLQRDANFGIARQEQEKAVHRIAFPEPALELAILKNGKLRKRMEVDEESAQEVIEHDFANELDKFLFGRPSLPE